MFSFQTVGWGDDLGGTERGLGSVVRLPSDAVSVHALLREPLVAGLAVSNLRAVLGQAEAGVGGSGLGTIGCFAVLNGRTRRSDVVLVANRHVLLAHGARKGDLIYQPTFSSEGGTCVFQRDSLDPIAEIFDEGSEGHVRYAYPGEPEREYFIDCAAARVFTERGVRVSSALASPRVRGKMVVTRIARVHPLDVRGRRGPRVYVIGQRGIAAGRVVDVKAIVESGGMQRMNNMILRADSKAGGSAEAFVQPGDSGALVVNERAEAVGLVWGKSEDRPGEAYACHIHPVVHRLGVTLVMDADSVRA